jgi:hypothetical protein
LKNINTDVFATKFEINTLFTTKSNLKLKINEKDIKSYQKKKQLTFKIKMKYLYWNI